VWSGIPAEEENQTARLIIRERHALEAALSATRTIITISTAAAMATVDSVSGADFGDKKIQEHQSTMTTPGLPLDASEDSSFADPAGYEADSQCDLDDDIEQDCYIGEASIVGTKGPDRVEHALLPPPALPQKSSLRASRLLEGFKLSPIETSAPSMTTRHDVYMSSEEDASSSAGDCSDYDWDSSSESSEGSPVPRKSYEDTARVVSVVFSGKPCIVDLPSPRRSRSPSTVGTGSETSSFETYETAETSRPHGLFLDEQHPPRTSSLIQRPSFLGDDPFADDSNYSLDSARGNRLDGTPRTRRPAVLNRVQRTFSLVRKRSRPLLRNPASESSESTVSTTSSKVELCLPTPSAVVLSPLTIDPVTTSSPMESPAAPSPRDPVRYSDIMRTARKNTSKTNSVASLPLMSPLARKGTSSTIKTQTISSPVPMSPSSPLPPKRSILSGLKNRRKSLRG
jgi:hypothetical protein